jgi:glycosyltransferase involved in cell wall biosynthesis
MRRSRRRLCSILHSTYPIDPRVAREVRVAIDHGFDVDIIALRRRGEPSEELVEGARVHRLPIGHHRGANHIRVALEYLSFTVLASIRVAQLTIRERYRVVHVNNPPDFLIVAALFPKLLGARVILDVHDLSSDMFDMRFNPRRGAKLAEGLLRWLERTAARVADVVITVHEPYREELVRRGVPAEKTEVVMNSVDETLLPKRPMRRRGDLFRVVYHGTVTPSYGVQVLVDAVAKVVEGLPNIRLEVYGEGDSLPVIAERAAALGIEDRVHLSWRYLPHDEVLELVSSADVGVIPNLANRLNRFALSSKLFEYVVAGVPVISAELPTIRAHFSEDELLFYPSGDSDALARALIETAQNPDAAAKRAEAARRRYEGYRWPVYADRYARILAG